MSKNVVINKCFGGFGLSDEAMREWANRKGYGIVTADRPYPLPPWASPDLCVGMEMTYTDYVAEHEALKAVDTELAAELGSPKLISASDIPRDDNDLVDVVREMGEKANGDYADLHIVTIPDGIEWYVEEYDGREHIAQQHQTWG